MPEMGSVRYMASGAERWTLEDLIDFEQALSEVSPSLTDQHATGSADKPGTWRAWLERQRSAGFSGVGHRFIRALKGVTFLVGAAAALAGATTVFGLWEQPRSGINVSLFLALILGTQWLLLIGALLAWIFRHRTGEAFSFVQGWIGSLALRFSHQKEASWWRSLTAQDFARKALLWRLARSVQSIGVALNLGALAALAGLVLFRNVGFFWETTTHETMLGTLEALVRALSWPWQRIDPSSVPTMLTIANTQWVTGQDGSLGPGPAEWWRFLLWSLIVWGMVPRWILRMICHWREQCALKKVTFQERHHRAAWRGWFGGERLEEIHEGPTDGALVIDVGGAGFSEEQLRPLLLRKIRVNPVAWERVGVLDADQNEAAHVQLRQAKAAIVLLAEGWALSPRQIVSLLRRAGELRDQRRLILLVGNVGPDGSMLEVNPKERETWEHFVDGLEGTELELVFAKGGDS
jgi:hypothetical protein